jgi:hypothetical protein
MRQQVWSSLDGNTAFYPQQEVDRAINEQVRLHNLLLGFYQDDVQITTVAGTTFYAIPEPMVVPLAVSFGGRQLRRSSLAAMGRARRNWTRETTATSGPVTSWIPIGVRMLAIHPLDAVGGRTITVYGICDPPLLVNDGDIVQAPDEVLDSIQEMAAHVLQLKEGGAVFAGSVGSYQDFQKETDTLTVWRELSRPRFDLERQAPREGG